MCGNKFKKHVLVWIEPIHRIKQQIRIHLLLTEILTNEEIVVVFKYMNLTALFELDFFTILSKLLFLHADAISCNLATQVICSHALRHRYCLWSLAFSLSAISCHVDWDIPALLYVWPPNYTITLPCMYDNNLILSQDGPIHLNR